MVMRGTFPGRFKSWGEQTGEGKVLVKIGMWKGPRAINMADSDIEDPDEVILVGEFDTWEEAKAELAGPVREALQTAMMIGAEKGDLAINTFDSKPTWFTLNEKGEREECDEPK